MSWDQYWHGDPWMVRFYRDKHNLDIESRNQELWLQGQYYLAAIGVALSKDAPPYPEKPWRITPMTEAEKRMEADAERQKAIKFFSDMEKRWRAKEQNEPVEGERIVVI